MLEDAGLEKRICVSAGVEGNEIKALTDVAKTCYCHRPSQTTSPYLQFSIATEPLEVMHAHPVRDGHRVAGNLLRSAAEPVVPGGRKRFSNQATEDIRVGEDAADEAAAAREAKVALGEEDVDQEPLGQVPQRRLPPAAGAVGVDAAAAGGELLLELGRPILALVYFETTAPFAFLEGFVASCAFLFGNRRQLHLDLRFCFLEHPIMIDW